MKSHYAKEREKQKSPSTETNWNFVSNGILDFTLCNQWEKRHIYPSSTLQYQIYHVKKSKNTSKASIFVSLFKDNLVNLLNPHWIVRRATGNSNFFSIFCNKFFKRKKLRVLFFFFIWVKCERFWENYWASHRNMIIFEPETNPGWFLFIYLIICLKINLSN